MLMWHLSYRCEATDRPPVQRQICARKHEGVAFYGRCRSSRGLADDRGATQRRGEAVYA